LTGLGIHDWLRRIHRGQCGGGGGPATGHALGRHGRMPIFIREGQRGCGLGQGEEWDQGGLRRWRVGLAVLAKKSQCG